MPEARCFISMQMLNESIHAEMYGHYKLKHTLRTPKEKNILI